MEDEHIAWLKKRAEIRRDAAVSRIEAIHTLAEEVVNSNSANAQFLLAAQDLDSLWDKFTIENDKVLEALVDLNKADEFSNDLGIRVRGLVIATKVISNKFSRQSSSDVILNSTVEVDRASNNGSSSEIQQTNDIQPPVGCRSRLPEIPLPKFSGELKGWPVFRDRFLALVDSRSDISDIDKFYYLLGCLHDQPIEMLKGINVSASTYRLAWDTLAEKYNKPRKLASHIIEELLSVAPAARESQASLSQFLTHFSEGVSVLFSLEIPNLSSFLLFILASRALPAPAREFFEAENRAEYPGIQDVVQFVKRRLHVLENSNSSLIVKPSTSNETIQKQVSKFKKLSLVTSQQPSLFCVCCKGKHCLASCSRFQRLSVDDRFKVVTGHKLCMVCFENTHWANKCKSKCPICSRKHHSLLHRESTEVTVIQAPPIHDSVGPC